LRHLGKFCEWLGVEARSLEFIMNQHRNPNVWEEEKHGCWVRKEMIAVSQSDNTDVEQTLGFQAHAELNNGERDRYIVIGKGYPT
jgi:hypothetical protein